LWLATVALGSVNAYLLNGHRPSAPSLADLRPARALDAVAILGLGISRQRQCAPYRRAAVSWLYQRERHA
jgi:hypothetical protein